MAVDRSVKLAFQAIQLALRGLQTANGYSVDVPQWRQTAARLWLKPPEELLDFLARWLKACQALDASGSEAVAAVNR